MTWFLAYEYRIHGTCIMHRQFHRSGRLGAHWYCRNSEDVCMLQISRRESPSSHAVSFTVSIFSFMYALNICCWLLMKLSKQGSEGEEQSGVLQGEEELSYTSLLNLEMPQWFLYCIWSVPMCAFCMDSFVACDFLRPWYLHTIEHRLC